MIKKGDLILAALLLAAALAMFLLLFLPGGEAQTVVVSQNGEIVYRGSLKKDAVITIDGDYSNTVRIQNGEVFMESATCPGQECVHMGHLSSGGNVIACVPNAVSITVSRTPESEVDAVAE